MWYKKLLCKIFGHKWEMYPHPIGLEYYSYDVEMGRHCKRCDIDTHRDN